MDAAERAALRSLQDDVFNARVERGLARADADHERECVVSALRILRGAAEVAISTRPDSQRVLDLCRLIDEATAALNRTRDT